MKPHRVLHEYFEVYGQAGKITPEAGEKRAPFLKLPHTNIRDHTENYEQQ